MNVNDFAGWLLATQGIKLTSTEGRYAEWLLRDGPRADPRDTRYKSREAIWFWVNQYQRSREG